MDETNVNLITNPVDVSTSHKIDWLPVIENRGSNTSAIQWASDNIDTINKTILESGALLIRNFDLQDLESFKEVSGVFVENSTNYVEGGTPRQKLGNNVYTSTEYPEKLSIFPHNELSYVIKVPEKIIFACLQAAIVKGATPIADCRKVLSYIDADIVEEFEARQWKLIRNFGTGLGPDLIRAFETEDHLAIEQYCKQMQMDYEKISEHQVRTTQVRPAVHTHPITLEKVWMNHIAFWHPSSMEPKIKDEMLAAFGHEGMPFNVFWGDGETISDDIIDNIRTAYNKATVRFDWKKGDILFMDNKLVAHGREPFAGPRKVVVAMGHR
ncbi:TauD/TfdA family dioxygenase [Pseudoalteromonas sp. MMG022]|uniref:TauD/TfdA family dioxygenase n=1 Tax=Pseudoalteromonas sp. MMG022 TaxID=2909978 RepID=UPI001F157437|nr:TauD/TfdA family dioxygenase [Pseudoalteromonas sp. MMG022]MCF6436738.1 TauD/TfdA family dioxygenase [Pseudoalteromonas sp. MMG022]